MPRVEEALQAVQAAVWFSSFDLAQGYLQMAMEEEDIEKTAFRAGSSGLYEFTRMPFGLTNAGASFCRLMEMCIGDQQYVTLLFYLDDICIFAETADQMLDCIEFVFSRLKEFNLKIKPKKSHFFQTSVTFLGHILSADGVSPNPEKVAKIKDWPTPKTPKEVHSFVGLASYYRRFIPNFAKWAGPLHALIVPASFKQKIRRGEMKKSDLPEFQCVTVVVSAIRARARINNIKANSVILRLLFSFSFHLKRRELKLRCRSNMPQPDSQRIILISNELQNIYLELFQIEFQ